MSVPETKPRRMTLKEIIEEIRKGGRVEIHALVSPIEISADRFWNLSMDFPMHGLIFNGIAGHPQTRWWRFIISEEKPHVIRISGVPFDIREVISYIERMAKHADA